MLRQWAAECLFLAIALGLVVLVWLERHCPDEDDKEDESNG